MATYFVDSTAGGGGTGADWANAFTTISRTYAAGDIVYVADHHAETGTAAVAIVCPTGEGANAPVRFICCDGTTGSDPGNLATGATVTCTSATNEIGIQGTAYLYGIKFVSGDDIRIGDSSSVDSDIQLESCILEITAAAGAGDAINLSFSSQTIGARITLVDCTLKFANTGQGVSVGGNGIVKLINTGVDGTGSIPTYLLEVFLRGASIYWEDSDLSNCSGTLVFGSSSNAGQRIEFNRCKIHASVTLCDTVDVPGFDIRFTHCYSGTSTDPPSMFTWYSKKGVAKSNTTVYRTGGGMGVGRTNPISQEFDTTVMSERSYPGHALEGMPIRLYIAATGSTTFTMYLVSDATINNDEFWFDIVYLDSTDPVPVRESTRVAPLTSASALTTDSGSTWSSGTVKQKVSKTVTIGRVGLVEIFPMFAKASDNIYVDTIVDVT